MISIVYYKIKSEIIKEVESETELLLMFSIITEIVSFTQDSQGRTYLTVKILDWKIVAMISLTSNLIFSAERWFVENASRADRIVTTQ